MTASLTWRAAQGCASRSLSDMIPITGNRPKFNSSLQVLSLSALGVVFGDIGTSPLYTLKTVLALTGGKPDRAVILGTLSLVIWTLIMVTTIKYVSFAMRINNDGEGGILALMSLLGVKLKPRPFIVALGLLGAALIYGDGAVTPAISVLLAINPIYGISYLHSDGVTGFLVLGGVFLCVTGAEALYADMGHFGARPIRLAWSALVFPSLVLNYAGQAALVLAGAPTSDNIFYRLCPSALLIPLVVLATIATIIASQSIITGAFSMTRQAIQLGWLPRLKITQTSAEGYGQIYVGAVNWTLMIVTCGLTLGFGKSDNLAAAYGIAVSATMLATSALLFTAMREIWGWGFIRAGGIAGAFIIVDLTFFAANSSKIASGGYVPLLLAGFVYGIMLIWHRGAKAVSARFQEAVVPIGAFMAEIAQKQVPRVPGTAVFLTRTKQDVPPLMVWHLSHNRALHKCLFVVTVDTESVPWVNDAQHLAMTEVAPQFWRASARYGFMERPDIPALLGQAHACGCGIDLSDITYYVGHETILPRNDGKGLPKWMAACFVVMQRNSTHLGEYFRLPSDAVVEIGRQISI